MYAIFETGGKQYRVAEGDRLRVERLAADEGAGVSFERVLVVSDDAGVRVGKPYLDGVEVSAEVTEHGRHDKVRIVKFRRRKHYMRRQGHRQGYTGLRITGIGAPGASASADAAPALAENDAASDSEA